MNYDGLTTQSVYMSDDSLSDAIVTVRGYFAIPTNPVNIGYLISSKVKVIQTQMTSEKNERVIGGE